MPFGIWPNVLQWRPDQGFASMANVIKVTTEKGAQFLSTLAASGANVTKAAEATSISRWEWYRTRLEEPEFAKAWAEALELGVDAL